MAKQKLKTHSGAKRRFKLTKGGKLSAKLMRRHIGISHNRLKKRDDRLRGISEMVPVQGGMVKRIKRLLPHGIK